ncbi:hypothetical protein F4808DRAFT_428316 [Astrocystis sublimbata]|nr:hypothetical protein F4808DRAFT_428316 [Astrocystis sublimbata]
MHFTTSTLLALACGNAFAAPTPQNAPRSANLPLPARTIFQLDSTANDSWFENIAIRRNGDLLVTMTQPNASLYSIRRPLSDSPEASVINIKDANGLTGIVETSPDVFAVAGATFSALAEAVAGTSKVWEVDFRGPEPTTRLIVKMPEAVLLNGLASISTCSSSAILIADSGLSRVWRVDMKTGAYETAVEIPEMQSVADAPIPLGVNGLKIRNGYLYFSNSNLAAVYRLRIDQRGMAAKGAQAELIAEFHTDDIDDFEIDERGQIWAATNFNNTVAVDGPGSAATVVVGRSTDLTVAGDTALAFGRTKGDKNIVYTVTGGALARPVNGTITEPAKIVAIDRTGF